MTTALVELMTGILEHIIWYCLASSGRLLVPGIRLAEIVDSVHVHESCIFLLEATVRNDSVTSDNATSSGRLIVILDRVLPVAVRGDMNDARFSRIQDPRFGFW